MTIECPGPEQLVAYLTDDLSERDRHTLEHHLLECDGCTAAVTVMHQRWRMADRVAVVVPAALAEHVAGVTPTPATLRSSRRWSAWRERWQTWARLPILMPTAFATGMLLMLAIQNLPWPSSQPLTRNVALEETLRLHQPARVYAAPDTHATVVTTLAANTRVDVRDQYRTWYRVVLPDGHDGWVEQAAFE